jgi:hypothetical protein
MEKVFKEFGIVAASKNGRQQDNPARYEGVCLRIALNRGGNFSWKQ